MSAPQRVNGFWWHIYDQTKIEQRNNRINGHNRKSRKDKSYQAFWQFEQIQVILSSIHVTTKLQVIGITSIFRKIDRLKKKRISWEMENDRIYIVVVNHSNGWPDDDHIQIIWYNTMRCSICIHNNTTISPAPMLHMHSCVIWTPARHFPSLWKNRAQLMLSERQSPLYVCCVYCVSHPPGLNFPWGQ